MIEIIKNAIYQSMSELFTTATMDEMTGDFAAFKVKLKTIAQIAEILGIKTEINAVVINIKTGETIFDVLSPDESPHEYATGVICK